ncbi:hypothetical protein KC845_03555 [Candidatus Kaiserbacteria bacterium]|nr:hypothetical protein [Candidatus Kaiserbacteria bacterium]
MLIPTISASIASIVISPVTKTKTWFAESTANLPMFFRDRTELINEISVLKSDLAGAGGNQFTIRTLTQENDELRSLLGYEGEERVLAGIIGRPDELPYDVLMIDRGSKDGIVEGAPVFINDSTIIGLVRSVTFQSSVVELITTPGFETTVFIIGPNIYTNALGIGGGQMKVGVPQGIQLSEGDLVVIPSITSGVYGEISFVQSEPTQPEQYGFVSTHIPLSSMRLVSVGKTPVSTISFEEAQEILKTQRQNLLLPIPADVLVEVNATSTATSSDMDLDNASGTPTVPEEVNEI